jgi:hypothetical protein
MGATKKKVAKLLTFSFTQMLQSLRILVEHASKITFCASPLYNAVVLSTGQGLNKSTAVAKTSCRQNG